GRRTSAGPLHLANRQALGHSDTTATGCSKPWTPPRIAAEERMVDSALRLLRTAGPVRNRIIRMYAFLVAFNVIAWAVALVASISYPILLPTAFLAYTFGLRHAVDADHI